MNVQNFRYIYHSKFYLLQSNVLLYIILMSKNYAPGVLNVHVNENKKKPTIFRKIFFSSSEKLTFEKENVILFNTFPNFNSFYLIVVNFCKFRSYECSELQVHLKISDEARATKKKILFFFFIYRIVWFRRCFLYNINLLFIIQFTKFPVHAW